MVLQELEDGHFRIAGRDLACPLCANATFVAGNALTPFPHFAVGKDGGLGGATVVLRCDVCSHLLHFSGGPFLTSAGMGMRRAEPT